MAILLGGDGAELLGPDGAVLTDGQDSALSTLDIGATLISQYANSPVITAIIEAFRAASDKSDDIDAFYDYLWNVATAKGYGLDVWGRIVGVTRVLTLPPSGDFGFGEGGYAAFGDGAFYSGLSTLNYPLPDDQFRILIMVKAAANISGASAPRVNAMLTQLFPGVRCYAIDLGSMRAMYTFEAPLTPVQLAVLTQSGAVPRPAGVQLWVLQQEAPHRFGFAEGGFASFGSGTFFGDPVHAGV